MPISTTYEIKNSQADYMNLDLKQGEYLKITIHGFINNPYLLPTDHPNYNPNFDIKQAYGYNPELNFRSEDYADRLEVISQFTNLNNLDTTAQLIIKANKDLVGLIGEANEPEANKYYLQLSGKSAVFNTSGMPTNYKVVVTKYAANETDEINKLINTSYENYQDATEGVFSEAWLESDGGTFIGNFGDRIVKGDSSSASETPITNYDTKVRMDRDSVATFLEVGYTYTIDLKNKSNFLSDKQFFSKAKLTGLVFKADGSQLDSSAIKIIGNQLKIEVVESGQYFIQAEALLDRYIARKDEDGRAVFEDNYFGPIAYAIESQRAKIVESESDPSNVIKPNVEIIAKDTINTGSIDYFGDKDSFTFTIEKKGLYFIELSEASEKYTNILGIQGKLIAGQEDMHLIRNSNNHYLLQEGTYNLLIQGFAKDKDYNFRISKEQYSKPQKIKDITDSKEIFSQFADNLKADFIKVSLEIGKVYVFVLSKEDSFDNIDLRILGLYKNPNSASANFAIFDDDSAGNGNAKIYYLAETNEDLYIKIAATNNYGNSKYHAKIEQTKLDSSQFEKYHRHVKDTPFFLNNDKLSDQENEKNISNLKMLDKNKPLEIGLASDQKGIVEITLEAGSWIFETLSKAGNMVDTVIYGIYDSDGNYISNTFNDNGGYDYLSKLNLEITNSGKYFIHIGNNSAGSSKFDFKLSDANNQQPLSSNDENYLTFTLAKGSKYQIIKFDELTKDTTYKISILANKGSQTPLENLVLLGLFYGNDEPLDEKNLTLIPTSNLYSNGSENKIDFYFTTSDILPYIDALSVNYFSDNNLFLKIGSYQQNHGDFKVGIEKVDKAPFDPNSFFDSINGNVKNHTNFHGLEIEFLKPSNNYQSNQFEHWKKIIADTLDSMWETRNGRHEIELLSNSGKKVSFNFQDNKDQAYFSGEISINYTTLTKGFDYSSRGKGFLTDGSENYPFTKEAMQRVIVHELLHVSREWGDPPPGQYNKHLEITNRIMREINGDDPNSDQNYDRIAYPIIFDLNQNGIADLVDKHHTNLKFDMNNDGRLEHTGWTNPINGIADGILVWDINKNSKIDNINEISFARFAAQKDSDLMGLKFFDKNNDWLINKQDKIYQELQIWQDNNHNGISEKNELFSLAELNIESINLRYQKLDYNLNQNQNQITKQATYNTTVDNDADIGKIWDVGFSFFG